MVENIYVGTYDSDDEPGIYTCQLQADGSLTERKLLASAHNAKCLDVDAENNLLVYTAERDGKAGIILANLEGQELDSIFLEKVTACYVAIRGEFIYTANYHEGIVLIYRLRNNHLYLFKQITVQKGAGCHQVMLWKDFIFVPCLKLDCVNVYSAHLDYAEFGKFVYPYGTGPRHCELTGNNGNLYVLSELSSELYYYVHDQISKWHVVDKQAISFPYALKENEPFASAAIRLSADKQFLYTSTRGADCITVFKVENGIPKQIQQVPSGGKHPRDFIEYFSQVA